MRQYRKGKRLIALCEQKILTVQRVMSRLNADRKELNEKIRQCDIELNSLEQVLKTLQFNDTSVTRADIFSQIKQQAMLLHQRGNVNLERSLHVENMHEIDNEIVQCQKRLAVVRRKEIKFTKWMQQGKQQWVMQQESVNEDEKLDLFPWMTL
jgi:hypothetical protein